MKIVEKRPNGTTRVHTKNTQPSRTDQSWKEELCVNRIVQRFKKTGQLSPMVNVRTGSYQDVSEVPDLHTGLTQIKNAEKSFQEMPQHIVQRFKTPQALLEFLSDPKNNEEAAKLGLKTKVETADKVKEPEPKAKDDDQGKKGTNS